MASISIKSSCCAAGAAGAVAAASRAGEAADDDERRDVAAELDVLGASGVDMAREEALLRAGTAAGRPGGQAAVAEPQARGVASTGRPA